MLSFLEIALINAVMVVPLALIAAAAGRVLRRPALTHLLWVLILVKLLTPPVCQIPILDREWVKSTGRQLLPAVMSELDHFEISPRLAHLGDQLPVASKSKTRLRTLATQEKRVVPGPVSVASVAVKWLRTEEFWQFAFLGLLMAWSLGALSWFVVQGVRCVRFRWSLCKGYAAGADLQRFADRLARRLDLPYSPTVWLMPGVMSPMLWGSGESLLLIFPEQMLDRLDDTAIGTLLTHELAHCRRRDHWVRVIALLATGFFWWHPVVWWARREIEAAEEECCDALVVAKASAIPKCYAQAILEVVDFLAVGKVKLPALATGLGQFPFLRQRLTWIMRGPRRQDFGYGGRLLCLLLACLLPLQPSWLAARSTPTRPFPVTPIRRSDVNSVSAKPVSSASSFPLTAVKNSVSDAVPSVEPVASSRWVGLRVQSHSSDGRFVVVGNASTQCLFDFKTQREFDLADFVIQGMAFAANSSEFVTTGADGVLRLWDAEVCEVIQAWRIPAGACKSVDITSDGKWIATGGRDGIVRIWDRSSPHPVIEFPRELAPVNCIRFSPEQNLLAVATGEINSPQTGRIALFETASWIEQISMNWNSSAAVIAFREDGNSLISGDWQGRVARWSIATGELLGLSEGHQELMAAAEFTSSGSPLVEIEIPDLPATMSAERTESIESAPWFFQGWGLRPVGNPTMAPNPARP